MSLKLNRLAIHYVDKLGNRLECAPQEQDLRALSPTIIKFFEGLVADVLTKEETGPTRSAHFVPDNDARLGPSIVKQQLDHLRQDDNHFFQASIELAGHMYRQTPGTASPGLLAVMQLVQPANQQIFIALIKIRHKDESFVRVLDRALTQLEVEQVENMLLPDIQKGVIIPHPDKPDFDLKLIDVQTSGEPARYFAESFLGCRTKKSDEHQVKKLLTEISKYGQERGLPVKMERLPRVITALQAQPENITTPVITQVIQEQEIYGPDFQPDDFQTYVDEQSDLGPVNVPKDRFLRRGKTAARSVTITFRDPDYRGLSLSGSPEMLEGITSVEGDTVTFVIRTTRNGFRTDYG